MSYLHKHTYCHYSVEWDRIKAGDFLFARKACSENRHRALDLFEPSIEDAAKKNICAFENKFQAEFPFDFHMDPMAGFVFGEVLRKWRNVIWVRDYFDNEVDIKREDELIRVSHKVTKLTVK